MKKLYIGNLASDVTAEQLTTLFSEKGEVASVAIITDRDTGKPRGFGFIEMTNDAEAEEAIKTLDGSSLNDQAIVVNEAHPPKKQSNSNSSSRRKRF